MPHGTAFASRSVETCLLENTSFVGRDRALAELLEAVEHERLTTLWGAAGVGKTRLLRRACAETTARGRVTVVEVMDLVPARDRAALVAAVAQALGISLATVHSAQAEASVGEALARTGGMLLALDGLEHLLPHADLIARWLAGAPALRVLCTSRAPLALAGERAVELEPLSTPSAVALFEDRFRAVSGRALAGEESALAERVARLVGGLPLAVELAAARAADLGVGGVAASLGALGLSDTLAQPARARAAVAWSVGLLGGAERDALLDLSACADGVAFDIAEAVLAAAEPAATLHALRRHALVWTRHGRHGELRCGVYSSVREHLEEQGAAPSTTTDRHARVVAAWAGPIAARARAEEPGALEALLDDAANLELALARAGDELTRATLAHAAATAAHRRGARDSHDELLAAGLLAARRAGLVEVELDLLERQGALAAEAGATRAALACADHCVALSEGSADRGRFAMARARRGSLRWELGELDAALDDLHAAISVAPEGSAALAFAHNRRGVVLVAQGEARGLQDLGQAVALAAHAPVRWLRTQALLDLAAAHRRRGAVELASQRLLEATTYGPPLDEAQRARLLLEQAALARLGGRIDDAHSLLDDAAAAAEASGQPALRADLQGLRAEVALDAGDAPGALEAAKLACAQGAKLEATAAAAAAWRERARAHRALGDEASARDALQAAALALARFPCREAAGLLSLERALLEAEAGGSDEGMAGALSRALHALQPLGGRAAALALATQTLLEPEKADRAALLAAARTPLDFEARALVALACGEPMEGSAFERVQSGTRLRRAPVRREMVVGSDGRYYELDGRRISLARQRSLRLIFLALVDEAERRPGHGLAQPEVLARGWPGEKMRADSGATRVYTSIRRLRKGGLEGVLVTRDDGYLIDPTIAVRRVAHA